MAPLIPLIFSGVKSWFDYRNKKAEAERELEIEETKQGIRGGDKLVKRLCFFVLFTPLVWASFDPESVKGYFETLRDVTPEWYTEIIIGVCASIWGTSLFRSIIGRIKK